MGKFTLVVWQKLTQYCKAFILQLKTCWILPFWKWYNFENLTQNLLSDCKLLPYSSPLIYLYYTSSLPFTPNSRTLIHLHSPFLQPSPPIKVLFLPSLKPMGWISLLESCNCIALKQLASSIFCHTQLEKILTLKSGSLSKKRKNEKATLIQCHLKNCRFQAQQDPQHCLGIFLSIPVQHPFLFSITRIQTSNLVKTPTRPQLS